MFEFGDFSPNFLFVMGNIDNRNTDKINHGIKYESWITKNIETLSSLKISLLPSACRANWLSKIILPPTPKRNMKIMLRDPKKVAPGFLKKRRSTPNRFDIKEPPKDINDK